ncbi:unnamed protein product [Adineta steineri]|uniref:Uncharacterized protein n=1 Tax=Adineta steineri TaxID=433720 RepID=A0A814AWA7_9BILA|nr:unnamed protein product [Adineta steineri]CAF0921028.1 unnamed protein product [Adineta steineri]
MAAIINALFGNYSEVEQPNPITDTNQTVVSNECLHTAAVADNVHVKSVISSETQASATINTNLNIDSLLGQLSTTYTQVDEYSRTRAAKINEQTEKSIAEILANIQRQQEELLTSANQRHVIIDHQYKIHLQKTIEALDAVKAKTLADLEHDLQAKQQAMMNEAKRQIDNLNDQAIVAKLNLLADVQLQSKINIDAITDQVITTNQQETQHLLQSTTTTVITSEAQSTANTETKDVITVHNESQVPIKSSTELAVVSATQENTTDVNTVTNGTSNLNTKSISPIATAANVTLNSNAVESIVTNARERSKDKTVQPVVTTSDVTVAAAAANVALDSNAVESIVTNTDARSKDKIVQPVITNSDVTIAAAANVTLNSSVIETIVANARLRSQK